MTDEAKNIDAALARIAALESELAPIRESRKNPPKQFDPGEFARAFQTDPIGMMKRLGVNRDHVAKVIVADVLGDEAPPELQMARYQGPQMSAMGALADQLQTISRRLDEINAKETQSGTKASLSKLIEVEKAKYPHLAKAYAADPSLFEDDVKSAKGDASVLAKQLEERLASVAKVLGAPVHAQPASGDNADNAGAKQSSAKPATGSLGLDVPPIPQKQSGQWSEDDDKALRDEIVRKYTPPSS